MELPIEHDPDFGGGEEEDLSPEWQEAAKVEIQWQEICSFDPLFTCGEGGRSSRGRFIFFFT